MSGAAGPGVICLQGGRELTPPCEDMDRDVLAACEGPVVVLAGAARVGEDYRGACGRARRHYEGLGAWVVAAPDPREDLEGCRAALEEVGLLVLPGGSPASLRSVLVDLDGGSLGARLRDLLAEGAGISGASAGAMVLCQRMVLPSRGRAEVDGLGLVPGLALVHWSGGGTRPGADLRWGLPECGGVLLDPAGAPRAVGRGMPSVARDGRWEPLPR